MSFSAKPQPLALISCTPHSRSLRRDFLGCVHSLRPLAGGLRSLRRTRGGSNFGRQSPAASPSRILIKASLSSHSILVFVAVVTFSAVSVVYWTRSLKPKKLREANSVGDDRRIDFDKLKEEIREARKEEEEEVQVLQFHNSSVISAQESPLSPLVFESTAVLQPLRYNKEVTEFDKIDSLFDLPNLIGDSDFGSAAVTVSDDEEVVTDESESGNDDESEAGEANGFQLLSGESAREEIHMFYEDNKHEVKLDEKKFSSFLRSRTLKTSDSSQHILHQVSTENVNGQMPNQKGGHVHSRGDLGNGNRHVADRELRHLSKKISETVPQLNGIQTSDTHYVSEQLKAYHRLLKDGRLTDSLRLLEDLEKKDLLDMNKVYHGRFFDTCKKKKAVHQAFRFIKLIPNPTMSTYNMLMSVCANSQDSEGAFNVMGLVREAGLRVDCKLYTTLISTCAKSGKVYTMFDVFHEMVSAGVEPNVHTYGALIDGCARAGEVAKAFGAYGIMRSKKVKPDRVVFNALITACGQSGAVDRAFDVLEEMKSETHPIEPDHTTVGALIKACANAGQVERAKEVYKLIHKYKIKGTSEVYTIAVNCCSQTGDWEFACTVYDDMTKNGVIPDEVFLSALIDVAGHAGKLDAAFEIIKEARNRGIQIGTLSYSSLMGACSNAKNWQKALHLYEDLKSAKIEKTVSTVNALITALCDGDQLQKAMEVLSEMTSIGLRPNSVTYSILVVASEKKDDLDAGLMLLYQAEKDEVLPNLVMCRCIIGMCLRRSEKACALGESVLPLDSGRPHVDSKWASVALMVYRKTIVAGATPTIEIISQVLGCLQLPYDAASKKRVIENLGVTAVTSKSSKLCSLIDGFGEYDPRAFSLLEEAASLGIVPCVSFKASPVVVDAKKLQLHTAEVYILTVLRGLKYRLAAGAKLPNMTILLPVEKTEFLSPKGKLKTINLSGRIGQSVASLLRRLGLDYQGNESRGKIRISGLTMKRWFQPKLASPFTGKAEELGSSQLRLGKGITHQQRSIRTGNLSLD
ncbi:pentatricopeptide repeat-containing protein MRL1, chloroplastic [Argentina anserina]|uniref:pentatricopeptide repeat-containing protein MRL1, chloroplastic n=1 Tax=Argentina anserina TaxID=57926 RepID=UPI0021763B81|nr:pentatricopeptide repeat-containing protein MRL1, chloroplastic [Potentilla anserina]